MRRDEIFGRWGRASGVLCWQFDSDRKSKLKLRHKLGIIV